MNSKALPKVRLRLAIGAFVLLSLAGAVYAQAPREEAKIMTALKSGNERFVSGQAQPKDFPAERLNLVKEQHPYAIVLACSDSRVPPEIVFDESIGKLFVVRTAGHVVDPVALGSIEYAVEHLHVNLLFVLGHEGCGAVKATIGGGDAPANIRSLLQRIRPAVAKAHLAEQAATEELKNAIVENVRYQMQMAVYESEVLADAVRKGHLSIAGGVYSLDTGKVNVISTVLAIDRGSRAPSTDHLADGHHGEAPAKAVPAANHGSAHATVAPASHVVPAHASAAAPAHSPTAAPAHAADAHGADSHKADSPHDGANHDSGHENANHKAAEHQAQPKTAAHGKSNAHGASKTSHAATKSHSGVVKSFHSSSGHSSGGHKAVKSDKAPAKSSDSHGEAHSEQAHKPAAKPDASHGKKAAPAENQHGVAEKNGHSTGHGEKPAPKTEKKADKSKGHDDHSYVGDDSEQEISTLAKELQGMSWNLAFDDKRGKENVAEALSRFSKQISELQMSKILTSW